MAAKYSIIARVNADGSGFMRTMNAMEVRAGRFANTLKSSIGARLAGVFSVGALGMQFRKAIDYGSQLSDMAARSGETVEQLQRLNKGLQDTGSTLQELEAFWSAVDRARMRALRDPGGKDAAGFERFGIGAADLSSIGKSQLTAQIAAKFQSAGDNWEPLVSTLNGMRLSVGNLVESFRGGLYQMNADMAVMTTAQANILDDLGDRWVQFGNYLSVKFAPILIDLMDGFMLLGGGIKLLIGFAKNFASVSTALRLLKGEPVASVFGSFAADSELVSLAKEVADMRDRIGNRGAEGEAWKRGNFNGGDLALDPITKSKPAGISPLSDSLLAVGNFLGSGRVGLETLATRQVQLLGDIARNTQRTVEKLGEDSFPVAD